MINPESTAYSAIQYTMLAASVLLAAAAITSGTIPGVYTVTSLALPIILGVGSLLALAFFSALAINRACIKQKLEKKPVIEPQSGINTRIQRFLCGFMDNPLLQCTEFHKKQFSRLIESLEDIDAPITCQGGNTLTGLAKCGTPLDFVAILYEHKANFSYQELNYYGNTALIWAIANAHNEMALELIKYGNPQNFDIQDYDRGNTALLLAVAKGYTTDSFEGQILKVSNLQVVNALLAAGANPNLKDKKGMSPLEMAVIRRDVEMVKALLQRAAQLDFDWKKCLDFTYEQACEIVKDQTIAFLLDRTSFETNKQAVFELLSCK